MGFDLDNMLTIIGMLITITVFISGGIAVLLRWSFNAKIELAQNDIETATKGWMDTMESNIKADIKELYSDKVNQAETEKDIERLQGDVIELKKIVEKLRHKK